jgi:hypothetical protein
MDTLTIYVAYIIINSDVHKSERECDMKRLVSLTLAIMLVLVSNYNVMAYTGIDPWFEEDYDSAENEWYIIPESFGYKNLDEEITRGEFCEIVIMAYRASDNKLPENLEEVVFTDVNSRHINAAYQLGIVSGYVDGTFKEGNSITRQEMFKMLSNLIDIVENDHHMDQEQASKVLAVFNDYDEINDWAKIATAIVAYKGIVKGSSSGSINPHGKTSRIEGLVLVTRTLNSIVGKKVAFTDDSSTKQKHEDSQESSIQKPKSVDLEKSLNRTGHNLSESIYDLGYNDSKEKLVFGETGIYQNEAEAKENMMNVTFDVWVIDTYGNKYPSTRTIKVNKAITEMVKLIFQEIFNGEERYPIKSVMSYAWRSNSISEHRLGLAIDINPNENYMIRSNGNVVAGSYWKPGEDPYSILPDGDVVNAFKKYGFAWGGNAWRSANDYMHFSYFGN